MNLGAALLLVALLVAGGGHLIRAGFELVTG